MAARPANPSLATDILRVTAEIIEEKGPEKITMREVAERLGYSATTIYIYFKDKDELLQATIDRAFDWFADAQDAAEDSASGVEILLARARAYVSWGLTHPGMYRLMFEHPMHRSAEPERTLARRRSMRRFTEALEGLMDSGALSRFSEVSLMVNLVWATLHGLTSLTISGRLFGRVGDALTAEEAKERTLSMVNASFEHWLNVWGGEAPGTNEFGSA